MGDVIMSCTACRGENPDCRAGEVDKLHAENAEMRRALEEATAAVSAVVAYVDDEGAAEFCCCLQCTERRPAYMQAREWLRRAALRAAENSPEARCGAEYGNACEGHGCPVHAGGEPESRESAPTAERAPDEPCKCGKRMLRSWWESVSDAGDMGTDYLRHSRTACLTATERASQAKAAAPPAAEGLTAAELRRAKIVIEYARKAKDGSPSALKFLRDALLNYDHCAAAEKAGER